MSFRPTHYPCSSDVVHPEHRHTDGPDAYYYICPGRRGQVDEREVRGCSVEETHACHGWVLESVDYWCWGDQPRPDKRVPTER